MKRTDPRQESLGWQTSASATLPAAISPPADSKAVRSLKDFEHLRYFPVNQDGKPNPNPRPPAVPCYVRLFDDWQKAEITGFYYDDTKKLTGDRVAVRILATGSRLEIRNREYLRTRGGDA